MYSIPASSNYLEAQYLIGVDYLQGNRLSQDYEKAMEWFQKSASEDYAPAQDVIGCMYSYGYGVEQDYTKALEWCLRAANQNYDEAQNNVGFLYREGFGGPKDEAKAFEWYKRSSEQNNADAQYELGHFYEKGAGVSIDQDQAHYWYSKAANLGHIKAKQWLEKYNCKNELDRQPILSIIEEVDKVKDNLNSQSHMKIPFKTFFDSYFCDESKRMPINTGGGVWFCESMNHDETSKFLDKAFKVKEKTDFMVDILYADFVIDTTFTRNFGEGLFLNLYDESYRFHLKNSTEDWEILDKIEDVYYSDSNKALFINDYKISLIGDTARFYGLRLMDCITAYLEQNDVPKIDHEVVSNSELVTNALDNIDDRLSHINQKLNDLREDSAA